MADRSLHRREFLRLSLVLAGSALAACQKQVAHPAASLTPPPIRSAGIRLDLKAADVWGFHRRVGAGAADPSACQAVWIDNNGLPVRAAPGAGSFIAEVPVYPGVNRLTARCQQTGQEDELSPEVNLTGRLQQRPTAVISAYAAQGLVLLNGRGSRPDELGGQPIREYIWSARPGNPGPAWVQADPNREQEEFRGEMRGTQIEIQLPPVDGEYYFSLRVVDETGREDTGTTYVVVEAGLPRIPDYDHENPAWVEEAIVYGVIPRLFGSPGAPAIQERLGELADLGINALWLAPVNATVDYGYSVTDYFELRDSFGSKEQFRAMVRAAHERGIRVLMDFVPNHTSDQHPYFRDTVEKGTDSPYWDFYDRDENGNHTYYFDWTHLPNLNYDNPEVRRMMIEAFSYWVRECDVDGFRVDACWGVQERRPDFWPEWRRELKRIRPDLLLLAEASARDPYNFENGFDAAYDWTVNLGQWAWGRFWGDQAEPVEPPRLVEQLRQALTNQPEGYHPDALVFRFLNNNDTRTRFIATHGEALTRVATALLLTLPGIPCIYTADEVGEWFLPYSDAAPLSWQERYPGLRDYHRKLIGLRRAIPALRSRLWQLLEIDPETGVLGYVRSAAGSWPPALVLLNFSAERVAVRPAVPAGLHALTEAGSLYDHLNDEQIPFDGATPVEMAPASARILTSRKEDSHA